MVEAQRSGAPNSSTSRSRVSSSYVRFAGSMLICAASAIACTVHPLGSLTRSRKRSVGAAAFATGSTPSTSKPGAGEAGAAGPS